LPFQFQLQQMDQFQSQLRASIVYFQAIIDYILKEVKHYEKINLKY
jgi:hypothetical protein